MLTEGEKALRIRSDRGLMNMMVTTDLKAGLLNQVYSLYALDTAKGYRTDIKGMEAFTGKGALEVGPGDIADYYRFLQDTFKPATVNRKITALSGLYSKAVTLGMITENPVKQLKSLKVIKTVATMKPVIQTLKIAHIRKALDTCRDERLKLVIKTLSTTGMRVSELIGMKRKNVTVAGDEITVSIIGKGRKERVKDGGGKE